MVERIALLGWGSLLWEDVEEFNYWHGPWLYDGPELRIEFSRISASRGGALTLVIDPENGVPTVVAYCFSRRPSVEAAVNDLRKREMTNARNIGYCSRNRGSHFRDRDSFDSIQYWATDHAIDGVVWTDLPSNFESKVGEPFSVAAAHNYLENLDANRREKALNYVRRAPDIIQTPLRSALADFL
jgi:hypothetical protein